LAEGVDLLLLGGDAVLELSDSLSFLVDNHVNLLLQLGFVLEELLVVLVAFEELVFELLNLGLGLFGSFVEGLLQQSLNML
jgi:hypothetical protein